MVFKTLIAKADKVLGTTVAESNAEPPPKVPLAESETAMMSLSFLACASFIILGGSFFTGDFSIGEIRVVEYISQNPLSLVVLNSNSGQDYPVYGGLLWLWMHVFGGSGAAFLRLPSLVLILLTAYVMYTIGRRVLNSPGAGFLAMALVLFSPALINNFSRLYGYSLSTFLAALATTGILYVASGERLKGSILFGIGALPLPAVISSGLALNCTLVLYLLVFFALQRKLLMNILLISFLSVLGSIGMITHILIPFKGNNRLNVATGIDSAGQWLVAIVAQVLLFILICAFASKQTDIPQAEAPVDRAVVVRHSLWILLTTSVVCSVLYLVVSQASPDTCLCFSVPLAFAAVSWFQVSVGKVNKYFLILIFTLLVNCLLWIRTSQHLIRQSFAENRNLNNLMQQFNSGQCYISTSAKFLINFNGIPANARIFVDHRIKPVFAWYWKVSGGNPEMIESLGGTSELSLEREHYQYLPKIAIGFSKEQVEKELQKALKSPFMLQPMRSPEGILIFRALTPHTGGGAPIPVAPKANPISHEGGDE